MSGLDEDKLVEQLVWSSTVCSLPQFVGKFDLPQVVRVEQGYCGESDKTSLDSDQILVMHFLRSKQKLVGEDSARTAIAISVDCRVKCQVYPLPMQCSYDKILTDQMSFVYPETKYFRVSEENVNKNKRQKLLEIGTVLEIKTVNSKTRSVICENVATKESVSLPFGCSTIFEPLLDYEEYTVKKVRKKFGLPAKVRFLEDKSETWNDPDSAKSMKLVSSLGKVTILHDLVTDTAVIATTVGGNQNTCLQLPKDLSLQLCLAEGLVRGEESYTNIVETLDQEFYNTALDDFDYGRRHAYQHLDKVDVGIIQSRPFERAESSGGELAAIAPELPPRNIRVPPPVRPPKRSSLFNKKLENIWPRDILPKFKPRREQQPAKQSIGHGNASSGFPRRSTSPLKGSKENEEYLAPLEDSDQHDYTYIDLQDIEDKIDVAKKSIQDVFVDFSVEIASDEIKQPITGEHSCPSLKSEAGSGQASAFSVVSPKSSVKQIARSNVLKRSPEMIDKSKDLSKRSVRLKSLSSSLQRNKSGSDSSEHVETTQPELDNGEEDSNYTDLNIYYVSSNTDVYQKLVWGKEELTKASIAQPEVYQGSTMSTRNSTAREDDYDEPDLGTPESLTRPSIAEPEVFQGSTMSTRNSTAREDDYDKPDSGTIERFTKPSIALPEVLKFSSSEKEEINQTIPRISQDFSGLSIKDVGSLLVNLSMAAYVQLFEDELVDGDMLASMDQESLESLNVSSYHIKKLLKFINGWRPNVTSMREKHLPAVAK